MKKLLVLFAIAFLTLSSLAACAPKAEVEEEPTGYEIGLVTDVGTIDDKSFNQGAWEGVVQYAEENGLTYQYYQPAAATTADYVEAITLAVEGGAKVVVTPGFMFAGAIYEAQTMYPEVNFILLDADPHTDDYATFKIESNVYSIYYAEEQSGYLAGYAAVKDGYTNLGFMGGMAVPAVVRFGHGFVQGAEAAAVELNVDVTIKYEYLNSFAPDDNHKVKALGWYSEGVEAIFVAAGGAGLSVMAAAEEAGAKVIGVDVDQSNLSETVITSAMKGLTTSVYGALTDFYAGSFKGGVIDTLDVTKNGVGLPADFSRFSTFTQADYDAVYAKLVSGEVVVVKDAASVTDLVVTKTTVTLLGTE
jgi:basic membrane protein A